MKESIKKIESIRKRKSSVEAQLKSLDDEYPDDLIPGLKQALAAAGRAKKDALLQQVRGQITDNQAQKIIGIYNSQKEALDTSIELDSAAQEIKKKLAAEIAQIETELSGAYVGFFKSLVLNLKEEISTAVGDKMDKLWAAQLQTGSGNYMALVFDLFPQPPLERVVSLQAENGKKIQEGGL